MGLFIHGRQHYRGTTYLVFYLLYKNVIHMFTFFWFAFYSGFSAQPLYLEYVWQMWNLAFTALPIFVYVLVDRDVADEILLSCTTIYSITNGNADKPPLKLLDPNEKTWFNMDAGRLFNWKIFLTWMFEAFVQSAFVLNVTINVFQDSTSFISNGKSWGLMSASIVIFTTYFLLMNFVLMLKFSHYTIWHTIIIFLTALSFFVYMAIVGVGYIKPMDFRFHLAGYDWQGLIRYLFVQGFIENPFWELVGMLVCVTLYTSQIPHLVRSLFFMSNLYQFQSYTYENRPFIHSCGCSRLYARLTGKKNA